MSTPSYTRISLFYAGVAVLGVVAVVAFVQLARKIKEAGEAVGKAIGDPLGDAIASIIVDDPVSVNAVVYIPSFGAVPFDVIVAEGSALRETSKDTFTFHYRGVNYRIVPPRRPDGSYDAIRA